MYFVIQENLFREEGHAKLIKCLERFKIPYELVDVKPFIEEFEYVTDRKDVFVFGSLKLARLSKKLDWNPGAVVTENHDYTVYSKYYKDNMLNYDSKIHKIVDDFEWIHDEMFIRPVLDSKIFTGKVFNKETWNKLKETIFSEGYVTSANKDTLIQVAVPKKITQEVRIWVVDGKIVTQSTYRRGTFLYYDNVVDDDALTFAQKMIDIFQLAKCFVIDVCLSNNEWKVVECGSISCAGFYDADMQRLVFALEDAYNNETAVDGFDDLYTKKLG